MKKNLFTSTESLNLSLGIFFIRVIIGMLMAFLGYEKLIHFNELAASDFWAKNVSFLGMSGTISLGLTVFAEFFCSILLVVGLLTRLSLIPLIICMGYIVVKIANLSVLETSENGTNVNSAFVYLIVYIGLFLTGAGKYSIDFLLSRNKPSYKY